MLTDRSRLNRGQEKKEIFAGDKVGIGERALVGYIRRGELPARKVCGAWLVTEDAVRQFFQNGLTHESE